MMNNYRELEAEVRKQAEAEFAAANGPAPEDYKERRRYESDERAFVRAAIDKWFLTTELHSSIMIRRDKTVEISDGYYGSSMTVYPPQRDWLYSEENPRAFKVRPAYINASTWDTGMSGSTSEHVQRRTLQYLKMVEIAIDVQNEMNQPVSDWPSFTSPFDQARWDHEEVLRYREAEKQKRDADAAKKAAKKVR